MAKKVPLQVRIVRVPSADAVHAQREAAKVLGQHLGELYVNNAMEAAKGQAATGA